jgi:L-fuculose-phosphate aldolase
MGASHLRTDSGREVTTLLQHEDHSLRTPLVKLCRDIDARGLSGPLASGNASMRRSDLDGSIYVTASGVPFAHTTAGSLVQIDHSDSYLRINAPDEEKIRPTSELELHLQLYRAAVRARVEVNTIIHLHSPYVVACSCLPIVRLQPIHYHMAVFSRKGDVPFVPYQTPTSIDLAREAFHVFLETPSRGMLLANHGGVVLGNSTKDALQLAELLEDICRLQVILYSGLGPNTLTVKQMEESFEVFMGYYGHRAG